eukprot:NODE_51_length_31136_cov_0.357670.p3 type:complete len:500 gc:universal NODE_51_length_31136_cov_0.357670:16668-15169(-)
MSGRQVKKQLKLSRNPEPIISSSSDDSSSSIENTVNAFAMLNNDDLSSEESESSLEIEVPEPIVQNQSKSFSKKHIDDLSEKQLSELLDKQQWENIESNQSSSDEEILEFFPINAKLFNFEAELNRNFGNAQPRFSKPNLVQNKPAWARVQSSGLLCQIVNNHYQISHSKQYSEVEFQFLNFFVTTDIQSIAQLSQIHSGHLNTLLLISEQYKASDVEMASDFVQRGLYVLQRFANYNNFTLDYNIEENRTFFILLLKHIYYVNRKGCWNASFELTKFLAKLDSSDPLYAIGIIDFQAIMAKQYDWLQSFAQNFDNLDSYPNLLYSVALSYFIQEDSKADDVLLKAFQKYPSIGKKLAGLEVSDLLAELSGQLHSKLWTDQKNSNWLKKIHDRYLDTFKTLNVVKEPEPLLIPQSAYRHSIIMDYDLFKYIPNELRNSAQPHDPLPPVLGRYGQYLKTQLDQQKQLFGQHTNLRSDVNPLQGLLQTLLPWVNNVEDPQE